MRTPEQISENIKISEFSPEIISKNEKLRGAACLLGAVHLGILNGAKSTYQEDYRGLKSGKGLLHYKRLMMIWCVYI